MKGVVTISLSFCLFFSTPLWPQQAKAQSLTGTVGESLQVSSDSLGALLLGQKIRLMMRDGTYVEGKVIRSSRDEITMRVSKSEPKYGVRGPDAALRTSDISVVHLRKNGTIAVPVVLGVVGGLGALYAAAFAADDVHSAGGYVTICLLSAAGGATGGALLGREAARKTLTINVAPVERGTVK